MTFIGQRDCYVGANGEGETIYLECNSKVLFALFNTLVQLYWWTSARELAAFSLPLEKATAFHIHCKQENQFSFV